MLIGNRIAETFRSRRGARHRAPSAGSHGPRAGLSRELELKSEHFPAANGRRRCPVDESRVAAAIAPDQAGALRAAQLQIVPLRLACHRCRVPLVV